MTAHDAAGTPPDPLRPSGPPPPARGGGETLDRALEAAASAPDRPAVLGPEGWLTHRQLAEQARQLAAGLGRLGVARGDRVAVLLESGGPAVPVFFGLARAGAVAAFVNPMLRARELGEALAALRPSIVIAAAHVPGNDLLAAIEQVHAGVGRPTLVVAGETARRPGTHSLAEVMGAGAGAVGAGPESAARYEDVAAILFTTGTTGRPKAVMHTHAGLAASIAALDQVHRSFLARPPLQVLGSMATILGRYRLRLLKSLGRQTWMTPLPLHSIAGFRLMLQALLTGHALVLVDRFNPRSVLELIERERVAILAVAPIMLEALLAVQDFDRYDLSSLVVVGLGSAPAAPALVRRARQRLGCPVLIGYGATETSGGVLVTHLDDSDAHGTETVGLPFPGAEVRIVDEAGAEVPRGTVGELCCRTNGLMAGYYGAPGATAEVVDGERFYYTGDLAVMDADGYVRIVGRKRDLIIRGGHKIAPSELERVLDEHPGVSRSAVVSVPDALTHERVWAFVVSDPEAPADPADVRAHCAARLAPHKMPDHIEVMPALPLTDVGEVHREGLRDLAKATKGGRRH